MEAFFEISRRCSMYERAGKNDNSLFKKMHQNCKLFYNKNILKNGKCMKG
jgi:hypothetical protein